MQYNVVGAFLYCLKHVIGKIVVNVFCSVLCNIVY